MQVYMNEKTLAIWLKIIRALWKLWAHVRFNWKLGGECERTSCGPLSSKSKAQYALCWVKKRRSQMWLSPNFTFTARARAAHRTFSPAFSLYTPILHAFQALLNKSAHLMIKMFLVQSREIKTVSLSEINSRLHKCSRLFRSEATFQIHLHKTF